MIVLEILKIIGIVLACILGFVILLLLVVSFVPLRYRMEGEGKNADIEASVKVTWLLQAAKACVFWQEKELSFRVSIFGKTLMKGVLGKDEADILREELLEEEIPEDSKQYEKISKQIQKAEEKTEKAKQEKEEAQAEKKAEKEAKKEEQRLEKEQKKEERKRAEKLMSFREKVRARKERLLKIRDKINDLREKVETWQKIWEAKTTKRALRHVKNMLFRILNHIKPRKIAGSVHFGMKDPADTAILYGGTAPLLEAAGKGKLIITPEFYDPGISMDLSISGRIFIGYMLLCMARIVLDRDVQRVVKVVRRNLNG